MTQDDPTAIRNSTYVESLNLDEIEAQTLDLTRDIDVTDGFCSTCHSMLDNWPDIWAAPELQRQRDTSAINNGRMWSPHPSSNGDNGECWMEEYGITYQMPCQGQTVRLDAATRKGCRCCGLILQTLKDQDWLSLYRMIEKRLDILGKSSKVSLVFYKFEGHEQILELRLPGKILKHFHPFIPIKLYVFRRRETRKSFEQSSVIQSQHPDSRVANESLGHSDARLWQSSTSQSSIMDLAKEWVSGCLISHPECQVERQYRYPSRLLYIAKDPLQLVITTGWTTRPWYATLSHCWGTSQFDRLETTNLDELRCAVPSRFLSKTFFDAVQITRAVGFMYLWIDSLCIIQDSQEDWAMEASMMASVYGGSSLNIAASSAKDGTGGCFLKHQHHCGGFTAQVCINGKIETLDFSPGDEYKKNVTESYLATRGWTVQEKALPSRTLHCGDQGLFWECKTRFASEYFPRGFCSDHASSKFYSVLLNVSQPRANWYRLIRWYTKCNLTNPEDKLIALSGVVRAIQAKTGDQYFAGLWREFLVEELCWRTIDLRERPEFRAPSWSWAAVDGPVTPIVIGCGLLYMDYVQVRSVSVMHPGSNHLGAVVHGTLSLLCYVMFRGSIVAEDVARTKRKSQSIRHLVNPDEQRGISFSDLGHEGLLFPFLLDCIEQKDSRLGQIVHYLPLRGGYNGSGHVGKDGSRTYGETVFGIVLEEPHGPLKQYRRIGCFEYCKPFPTSDDDGKCYFPEDSHHFVEFCSRILSSECEAQSVNII